MADFDEIRVHADALFSRGGGLYPPSSVIASWPAPNYVDPETRGWTGPIILIIFATVTTAVFIARMWARMFIAKNAGLDDLLMTIAMVPLIGLTIVVILAIRIYGFQWHAWDQTSTTLITSRQITLGIELAYILSTSLIKISILCFYRRITNGSISRTFVYLVWMFIGFVVMYCIAFIFAIMFTCTPIEGYWHLFDISWRLTHEVHCHNEGAETVAVVVISTLQDFFICALPIFLVWNLQISRRQKAGLIGIFALGLVTCICGIMRTYYAIYVYYYTFDITWIAFYGWIWTALEADLAVVCASAPALKVFFRRFFNLSKIRSGYGPSSSRGGKTPTIGTWGNGVPRESGNVSKIEGGRRDLELQPFKESTMSDVTIYDRQGSDAASTRGLTALPEPVLVDETSKWVKGYRKARATLRSDVSSHLR